MKPQLVLDAGGVLVANLSPLFWQQIAGEPAAYDQLVQTYQLELREDLWNGKAAEPAFWHWLRQQLPQLQEHQARRLLHMNIQPLPAMKLIPEWHEVFDIHLLSNHRSEWLLPLLSPVRHCFSSMTISSQFGSSKPAPAIFAHTASLLPPGSRVLYIDDQLHNLPPAESLGWSTLQADNGGRWVRQVLSFA
ncbi:hypothetical protein GCM10010911_03710 [Paenibacillus nasutitermitis]|uniref:Hydrolase of the HAD superfamily n=2 Tax=Paenibacillus nasutitermitis TaxID=1652958 RepID=A0A917DM37_9BACL|nr:hypothetical protein GCM10010911_03710 [Paenibacillus nasutitermitis]